MFLNGIPYIEVIVPEVRGASNSAEAFSMILVDKEKRYRYLPVIIGFFEARAILGEIHNQLPFRPLTHTLFSDLFDKIIDDYAIEFVSIDRFKDGIYYASIVVKCPNDTFSSIDARPSDAIAIALHSAVPIYINEKLFDEKHIESSQKFTQSDANLLKEDESFADFSESVDINESEDNLMRLPLEILEDMLKKAIEEENYEYASDIQKVINKLKGE